MRRSKRLFMFLAGISLGLIVRQLWINRRDISQALAPAVLDWLVRDKSVDDLVTELEASGSRITQQLMNKQPTERNYKLLSHIIGIERWGQSRLTVLEGAPFVAGEYDPFRPPVGLSWNELQDQFKETRAKSLGMIKQLDSRSDVNGHMTVLHNDFGELNLSTWSHYLRLHAENTALLIT